MSTRQTVERLLSRKQVRELVGLSFAHMDRLTKQGRFPKPIKLTDAIRGRVAYLESEIIDWIAKRIALRSVQPR